MLHLKPVLFRSDYPIIVKKTQQGILCKILPKSMKLIEQYILGVSYFLNLWSISIF
jgi:hypothetical protein